MKLASLLAMASHTGAEEGEKRLAADGFCDGELLKGRGDCEEVSEELRVVQLGYLREVLDVACWRGKALVGEHLNDLSVVSCDGELEGLGELLKGLYVATSEAQAALRLVGAVGEKDGDVVVFNALTHLALEVVNEAHGNKHLPDVELLALVGLCERIGEEDLEVAGDVVDGRLGGLRSGRRHFISLESV